MKNYLYSLLTMTLVALSPLYLSGQTTDPVKIADLKERFTRGIQLENDGKFQEALEVFKGVIKDEPKARGSLFYAGLVELQLDQPEEAAAYLNSFRELEPKDFKAVVLLIQANQALRRTVKVEALRKELFEMRSGSNVPGLTDAKSYVRERIPGDKGSIIRVSEFFDAKVEPNIVLQGEQVTAEGDIARRLMVFYNSDETNAARAKSPKFADVEVFDFSEEVLKDGKPAQMNVYRQEYEKPAYETARKWIIEGIKEPPKPLMTVPLQ